MDNLNEELLGAWLRVSTAIINSRIVSELPYNEALICNALYRNLAEGGEKPLTATDLCAMTNMLKSQMNRTLNQLEEKGLILRERSTIDRRQIYVMLRADSSDLYARQHQRILGLLDGIIGGLGEEKAEDTVKTLHRIADIADEILKDR